MDDEKKLPKKPPSISAPLKNLFSAKEATLPPGQTLLLRRLLCGMKHLALSFLLAGGEILGAVPFAFAFVASTRTDLLFALVGAVIRGLFFGKNALPFILSIGAIALSRTALAVFGRNETAPTDPPVQEGPAVQIILACAGALASSVTALISSGFSTDAFFSLLVSLALQPLLVLGYRAAFDPDFAFSPRSEGGQLLLALTIVIAAGSIPFPAFSLDIALAFFLTLVVAEKGGALRAGAYGMLFGTVCSPSLAPVIGIAGILCGILAKKNRVRGALVSLGLAIFLYLRTSGLTLLSPAPDLLLGTLVYLLLTRLPQMPTIFVFSSSPSLPGGILTSASLARQEREDRETRIAAMSDAISSLSGVFYQLSNRMKKPAGAEVRVMIEGCMRKKCLTCPKTTLCWVREQTSTEGALTKMTAALCKEGILSLSDVPEYLTQRCHAMQRIITEINESHIDALENAARLDKLEVISFDYRAMAKLLAAATRSHAVEHEIDPKKTKQLAHIADAIGLKRDCLSVSGKRRIKIVAGGVRPDKISLSPREIKEAFENALDITLTSPRFDLEEEYVTMSLDRCRKFRVDCATLTDRKQGETLSGDTSLSFEGKEDDTYLLISDGMGSGSDAALTSRLTSIFLRSMLSAGNDRRTSLEMLNNFIRAKNLECFATLDLLCIDLLSGEGCFVKSGAAPSFILRDGRLFRIASATLPIGITREIRCEEVRFDLRHGDLVVMLSDGILGEEAENDAIGGLWLCDLLTYESDERDTPQVLAEKIMLKSTKITGQRDDRTILVARIVAL